MKRKIRKDTIKPVTVKENRYWHTIELNESDLEEQDLSDECHF